MLQLLSPKTHIVFASSSSDSGSTQEDDADDVEPDDDDDDDDEEQSDRAFQSAYVGRGNMLAVRAGWKKARLNEGFARGDPLLTEFADFMKTAGSSEKDIGNKVSKNNSPLFIFILDFMRRAESSEKDIGNKVSKNNLLWFILIMDKRYIILRLHKCLLS